MGPPRVAAAKRRPIDCSAFACVRDHVRRRPHCPLRRHGLGQRQETPDAEFALGRSAGVDRGSPYPEGRSGRARGHPRLSRQ